MEECKVIPVLKNNFIIEKSSCTEVKCNYILTTPYKKYKISDFCFQIIDKMDGKRNFDEIARSISYPCDEENVKYVYYHTLSNIGLVEGTTYEKVKEHGFLVWKKTLVDKVSDDKIKWVNILFSPIVLTVLLAVNILSSSYFISYYIKKEQFCSFSEIMGNPLYLTIPMLFFYVSLLIHELGHYCCCYKQNGIPGEIGVGAYFIMPVLYTNLDDVWKLSKRKRLLINLSGIYFQNSFLFLCEAACWIMGKDNAVMFFIYAQLATLCNLIPFIKLDGYWIVVDLLDYSNLFRDMSKRLLNQVQFNKARKTLVKKKHNIWIELYYICFVCFITVFSCYLIYYFCSSFYKMLNQFNNEFNWMMTGYSVIKLLVLVFLYLRMLQVIKREGMD